jgi:hypothetical protein
MLKNDEKNPLFKKVDERSISKPLNSFPIT